MSTTFIFGIHAVTALLQKHPERIVQLYVLRERHDQKMQLLTDLALHANLSLQTLSRQELDKLTSNAVHQGIAALCHKPKVNDENDLNALLERNPQPFLLILDGVTDPHNLGACLRSADAAGVDAVIVPKDKSASITATVSKVACGAAETIPFIQVTNLARTMRHLKEAGVWLYGAAGDAQQNLYQTNLSGPLALVMGAEGEGLRRLTREHCDLLIHIPMQGTVASLNVSVATGVFLFEAVRQRLG